MIRYLLLTVASNWADQRYINANRVLRNQITRARQQRDEARKRLGHRIRAMKVLLNANSTLIQVAAGYDQMRQQAEHDLAAMAAKAGLDDAAWADVAAVAGPQPATETRTA